MDVDAPTKKIPERVAARVPRGAVVDPPGCATGAEEN
jgi:hypothetical protein